MKWRQRKPDSEGTARTSIFSLYVLQSLTSFTVPPPWLWQVNVNGTVLYQGRADNPEAAKAAAEGAYLECMVREISALSSECRGRLFDALREAADAGEGGA